MTSQICVNMLCVVSGNSYIVNIVKAEQHDSGRFTFKKRVDAQEI